MTADAARRDDDDREALGAYSEWLDRAPWEPFKFEVGMRVRFRRSGECSINHDIPDGIPGTVVKALVGSRVWDFPRGSNGGHSYPVQPDSWDDGDWVMLAAAELIPLDHKAPASAATPGDGGA